MKRREKQNQLEERRDHSSLDQGLPAYMPAYMLNTWPGLENMVVFLWADIPQIFTALFLEKFIASDRWLAKEIINQVVS